MASRLEINKNNFEIIYEAPWGGVNADVFPADIQENQFAYSSGFKIKQGVLVTSMWNYIDTNRINLTHPNPDYYWLGMFYVNGYLVLFDNAYSIYHYDVLANQVRYITGSTGFVYTTFRIINNSAYIFCYDTGVVMQYTPTSTTTGDMVIAPPYVAGRYTATLKNYLITANSNQPADDPAVKPARFSWSTPNAYTQFDPSVDRTAGYNVLGDVQDQITGLFIQGNVGYILRTQGITQFSPTGDPLGPFSFDNYWGDDYGIGCDLPGTLATFGSLAIFGDSSGIYSFQGGAVSDISYGIKILIQKQLIAANSDNPSVDSFVTATIYGSAFTDTATDINYALLVGSYRTGLAIEPVFDAVVYTYSIHNKCWTIQEIDLRGILVSLYPTQQFGILDLPTTFQIIRAPKFQLVGNLITGFSRYISSKFAPYILASGTIGTVKYNLVLQLLDENPAGFQVNTSSPTIVFKMQEIKIGRSPTVRGVVIRASGTGTLHVSISGVAFTDVVLDNSNTKQIYKSSGMYTDLDPQLTISSDDFIGVINKVMIIGTFADGDII